MATISSRNRNLILLDTEEMVSLRHREINTLIGGSPKKSVAE
jgi:hypothetical protein